MAGNRRRATRGDGDPRSQRHPADGDLYNHVDELIRGLIETTARERRFATAAMQVDSTVVEADIRYPTDAGLAATGARLIARAARRLRTASDGADGDRRCGSCEPRAFSGSP
jgi:hypothetical protein